MDKLFYCYPSPFAEQHQTFDIDLAKPIHRSRKYSTPEITRPWTDRRHLASRADRPIDGSSVFCKGDVWVWMS